MLIGDASGGAKPTTGGGIGPGFAQVDAMTTELSEAVRRNDLRASIAKRIARHHGPIRKEHRARALRDFFLTTREDEELDRFVATFAPTWRSLNSSMLKATSSILSDWACPCSSEFLNSEVSPSRLDGPSSCHDRWLRWPRSSSDQRRGRQMLVPGIPFDWTEAGPENGILQFRFRCEDLRGPRSGHDVLLHHRRTDIICATMERHLCVANPMVGHDAWM